MYKLKWFLSSFALFAFTFCNRVPDAAKDKELNSLSVDSINNFKKLKIFFGHQSVGYNIVDGLGLIGGQDSGLQLNIVETKDNISDKGIFAHAACGENTDPHSKINEFSDILKTGIGGEIDIALLKFCYIDVFEDTNVEELFNKYVSELELIKKNLPGLQIVHVTIPLRVHENKKNVLRHEYNELLRAKYNGNEVIYDIAKVESTTPEGKAVLFEFDGKQYPKLYKKYASDAGHLNTLGQWYAAKDLLLTLTKVEIDQ